MIRKYIKFEDPLVRFTFNTTAAERQEKNKTAIIFIQRGPNVAPVTLPVGWVIRGTTVSSYDSRVLSKLPIGLLMHKLVTTPQGRCGPIYN